MLGRKDNGEGGGAAEIIVNHVCVIGRGETAMLSEWGEIKARIKYSNTARRGCVSRPLAV